MKFWTLVFVLAISGAATAEVRSANPGFGEREVLKYLETTGNTTRSVETTVSVVGEGAQARIEYRSTGSDIDAFLRLDPATLLCLSSESVTKTPDATVRRTAEYRDVKAKAGPEDLLVTDFSSLPVVLRGFPWEQRTKAQIVTVGATMGGSGFSFELTVTGRETLKAAGRSWECWKVTTGLGGALALLMAKSEWWFAVEGSHPVIKMSGPAGGPGSPLRTLVLQSASGLR